MSTLDLSLQKGHRLVLDEHIIDIYYQDPIPIANFTSITLISASGNPTSGTLLFSTFPASGIDLYNRDLGKVGTLDLSNSGTLYYENFFDSNLRRTNLSISGAFIAGKR